MQLTDKVAVVTGAAVGIGRGIAECLLADGLTVIGLDRDRDALDAATATLGASFVPCVGDISIWGMRMPNRAKSNNKFQ